MNFTKYVAMLESRCLYFCRADHLGDPYESSMPMGMIKKFQADISKLSEENTAESQAKINTLEQNLSTFYEFSRMSAISMYINCWHMNKHESDAMWKVYLNSMEGVAVLSSPKLLVNSLKESEERISIGKVQYADYETLDLHDPKGGFNLLNFISRKRLSFRHEAEVRAVIWRTPSGRVDKDGWVDAPSGIQVPVDLDQLIQSVYVSPSSPPWFYGLVKAINDRYKINAEVLHSRMAQSPPQLVSEDGRTLPPTTLIDRYRLE